MTVAAKSSWQSTTISKQSDKVEASSCEVVASVSECLVVFIVYVFSIGIFTRTIIIFEIMKKSTDLAEDFQCTDLLGERASVLVNFLECYRTTS